MGMVDEEKERLAGDHSRGLFFFRRPGPHLTALGQRIFRL